MMIGTPCIYMEWNEILEKDRPRRPAVDCKMDCDHCGWNPSVAEARIKKMNLMRMPAAHHEQG